MPSLRIRTLKGGSATYTVLFRDDGRQTSETFDTERAARAFMRDVERHGTATARRILDSRRTHGPDVVRTVAEQITAHVAALSGITLGTRRRYERIRDGIAAHRLGTLPLDVVHRTDVADWVRDLADAGLSGKTINLRKQLLSAAFVRAVDDELMVRNPAHGVKAPRTERREMCILTAAEFDAILERVDPPWRPLILTLAGTGLRIGEATALQVRDVHLDQAPPTLTVSRGWVDTGGPERITGAPKTERGRRTIALPPRVVAAISPLAAGRPPSAWLFVGDDGGPASRDHAYQRWIRWVKSSGIGKAPRLHDLRHTHVSWLIADGLPLTTIQHRLGHASIKVTSDVYGHLLPESQIQAARAAERALSGGAPQIEA